MNKVMIFVILFLNLIQQNNAAKNKKIVKAKCGPVCAIFCEFGNVLDANGCPTCRCNPAPICMPVACRLGCPNGFAKGEDGCEICACAPTVCSPVICLMLCPNGWKKDIFGCDICECEEEPQTVCTGRICPDGFYCKVVPGKCSKLTIPCTPKDTWMCAKICPVFKCMACKSGYVIDKFGCQTCACKDPCERNDCVAGEKCVNAVTASRYKCIPSCSCPKDLTITKICQNIWNPCAAGCPRGSRCCTQDGCNICHQCD